MISVCFNKILTFTLTEKDNIKYIGYELTPDTDENNIKLKNGARQVLNKIFKGFVCYNGFKGSIGNILNVDTKPIKELSNYNMTDIKKSTEVLGISIKNKNITCITTSNKQDMLTLNTFDTFKVYHSSGMVMYIFNETEDINIKDFIDCEILINDYVPVWTLDGNFRFDSNTVKDFKKIKMS